MGGTVAGTLLFIHGTGVRKAGYDATREAIEKGLAKAGVAGVAVVGLPWGDQYGVKVTDNDVDDILPPAKVKAIGQDDAEWEAALWAQLLQDPLFELRMASIRPPPPKAGGGVILPGGDGLPEQDIQLRVDHVRQTVADPLPGGVSAASMRDAAAWLLEQPVLREAAAAAGSAEDHDLVQAVARALVAKALVAERGETGEGPDALYLIEERRELVAAITPLLAAQTKGLGGWLFGKVKDFATAQATAYGRKRRDELMQGVSPGVGDILLYQRRGDDIRNAIERKILELGNAGGPLVVLGHSLGGIMLVDLLTRPRAERLPVDLLVTVASQSPMFLKCDALETMRRHQPLPPGAPYTPWLNVYDRNDFLAFCASRAFPGVQGIEDFEVSSGVPFPDSHGAYFRMKEVYEHIKLRWP